MTTLGKKFEVATGSWCLETIYIAYIVSIIKKQCL